MNTTDTDEFSPVHFDKPLVGIVLGARIERGPVVALLIILLSAWFGVAYAGFGMLVALRTRNVPILTGLSLRTIGRYDR